MSDLIEFLEARIGEDEAVALAASPPGWTSYSDNYSHGTVVAGPNEHGFRLEVANAREVTWRGYDGERLRETDAAHIARHDPARVLAECAAKRELLQLARHIKDNIWQDGELKAVSGFRADQILRVLLLPYTSHPDYDPAWRD